MDLAHWLSISTLTTYVKYNPSWYILLQRADDKLGQNNKTIKEIVRVNTF
jgi:hypothetical protein